MTQFDQFKTKYGPWALITGASTGIGEAFAHQLAARGLNVVLVARGQARLAHAAANIRERYRVEVRPVAIDLTEPQFLEQVREHTKGLEIGLLINNASMVQSGAFLDHDLDDELNALAVNTRGPLVLTHAVAPQMRERGHGGIIFLGSTMGYTATPNLTSYAAAKSFNLLLGEGLWYELKRNGIDALTLSPGPTKTPLLQSMLGHTRGMPGVPALLPEQVAAAALNTLGKRPSVIPGFRNRMMVSMMLRVLPRRIATIMAGQLVARTMPARANTPSPKIAGLD